MSAHSDRLDPAFIESFSADDALLLASDSVCRALASSSIIRPQDMLICNRDIAEQIEPDARAGALLRVADDIEAASFAAASEPFFCSDDGVAAERCLIWLVSSIAPTGARVADIGALADAAAQAKAVLIVDNSIATHFCCTPLLLGADAVAEPLVVSVIEPECPSDSVSLSFVALAWREARRRGGKHACGRARGSRMRLARRVFAADIDEVELSAELVCAAERAVRAQALCAQKRNDHARAIAEYLSCHPRVEAVRYPGFEAHVDHERASRVLRHGFGPIIEIDLDGIESATSIAKALDHRSGTSASSLMVSPSTPDQHDPARITRARVFSAASSVRADRERGGGRRVILSVGTDDPLVVLNLIEHALAS
ncbi:Cys/Met metabolism pyridoxal-phosphate-dependent protein [Coriobacterium glomerans PW2]|uniref:Cys/Met metabolism pyridoxal-phosphate-dependent protein n=1 Tax=Coriobacterium glomerans (strain ATCC 49209 / DSM 20642 / JCM 10262 / PW2) TaxID=700015 RepID=F2N7N7_CORGP|nr:PLP-dependent transferase [Coriobacterium glomerans]AEB06929.1 Cys/Met metabolism pyridoxal-phosphate-dependent protein [Coriobacterium glomerans PW2]